MASRKQDLTKLLDKFYHNPVAVVSFELFLSISTIIFFAVFAIRPTLVTMADLIKEIEDKEKLEVQMSQKIAALGSAQAQYVAIQDRVYVLDEAIPTGPDLIYTLKVVEKAASDQDVLISGINILEVPEDPDVSKTVIELDRVAIPIQVSLEGNYLAIRSFVEQLRNSRRSFLIERVTFSTQESRGDVSLKAVVLLNAPYFGELVENKK